jgi:pimeloyl-ACP methyl ester carboxylesterase
LAILPHLDDVAGLFAGIINSIGLSTPDTFEQLDVYRGLPIETLFPAPKAAPVVRRGRRWALPGILSEDVIFPSEHEPLEPAFDERYENDYPEVHTVYARRLRTAAARGRPRLLYIHGYMQPETLIEEVGIIAGLARRLDMEVIQLQPPYHGRRKPRASRFDGELYWTADAVRSIEALRQTLLDARSLLSWMQANDPRPVGIAGISLGGALSAALTCLEERFAFSIPLVGHMDMPALLHDAPVLTRMRRELAEFGWSTEEFAAFFHDIGWNELTSKLPPERILLLAASDDRFFDPEVVEAMWERWGRPRIEWYPASHMGFFRFANEFLTRIREFVDEIAAESGSG